MRDGLFGKILIAASYIFGCAFLGYFVVAETSNIRLVPERNYTALFRDVSTLEPNQDVRIAGVNVGTVEGIEVRPDNLVAVMFTVEEETPVLAGSGVVVRYKNLVGERYLEITEGTGSKERLPDGGVIPVSQTTPALDLDDLYNGFAPLFEGLQPDQVNQLTGSLIAVLQGQGNAIDSLLGHVGSLTNTLANRDAVIGELITNLNTVLSTVNDRRGQVTNLVDQLQQLISGLAEERKPLGESLVRIDRLAGVAGSLVEEARPPIKGNVAEILRLSEAINKDSAGLNELFRKAPGYYQSLGRLGSYGSAFQFYLCGAQLRITPVAGGPTVLTDIFASQEFRCQY